MICIKCDGKGYLREEGKDKCYICPKCKGNKEYDWLENILGVDHIRVQMRKYPFIDLGKYYKDENPLL